MKERIRLILRIIATSIDLLLETKVDISRAQSLPRCSIEGLWMARS
jgi:hypothetical protein